MLNVTHVSFCLVLDTHGSNDNINYYIDLFRSASNVIETQARNNSDTKPFNHQMITGIYLMDMLYSSIKQ